MEPSDPLPPDLLNTSGLQIIGDSGSVMIDQNYRNLCVRPASDTALIYTGGDSFYIQAGSWVVTPFIALRAPTHIHMIEGSGVPSGGNAWFFMQQPDGFNFQYWYVDVNVPGSFGNVGMQVYNGIWQEPCFDSNQKQLRFVDHRNVLLQGWDGVWTYPAGRTYAIINLEPFYQIQFDWSSGSPVTWYYEATATISGTTVTYGWKTTYVGPVATPPGMPYGYNAPLRASAIVIDVTGY